MHMAQAHPSQRGGVSESSVRELSASLGEPGWLLELRLRAWRSFLTGKEPASRHGIGTVSDFSRFTPERFAEAASSQRGSGSHSEQCPEEHDMVVIDLHAACAAYPELVRGHLFNLAKPEEDTLAALHAAFWTRGLFVHIPPGTECRKQLQLSFDLAGGSAVDHVLIVAGKDSAASILEVASAPAAGEFLRSHGVEVVLAEGARVSHAAVQALGGGALSLSRRKAGSAASSKMEWTDCALGSGLARTTIDTSLLGAGAEVQVHGLFFAAGEQRFDLHQDAYHLAPETKSDMHTRGALSGRAYALSRGLISVDERAPRSHGYQRHEVLLLSEEARADALPVLEIANHDVTCSHGATLGQLDAERVFYLMSRGLPKEKAVRALVEGFFEPLFARIERESLQEELRQMLHARIAAAETRHDHEDTTRA